LLEFARLSSHSDNENLIFKKKLAIGFPFNEQGTCLFVAIFFELGGSCCNIRVDCLEKKVRGNW